MDFFLQSHLNTFFQNSTLHRDATFNEEKGPNYGLAALSKNSPSLATYSHLNIIPKVARIQLNSSQSQVHCCVQERKSYVKRTIR